MNIVIASGKGGTGKTTLAINLAFSLSRDKKQKVRLLDCDVEAPNDHLFLDIKSFEEKNVSLDRPQWNADSCLSCGKCIEVCHYTALAKVQEKILVFDELCHSCGACFHFCPTKSLAAVSKTVGKVKISKDHSPFSFVQGILNIGESQAPAVIKEVKDHSIDDGINIIDASPGTACPVVKAFTGADLIILVTEPTPFGRHDLALAINLATQMNLPCSVVINRSQGEDGLIENLCKEKSIPIIGKIPYGRKYAESYSKGEILVEKFSEISEKIGEISDYVLQKQKENLLLKIEPVFSEELDGESHVKVNKMKELLVISGKGGTGKTTLVGALSQLMKNTVFSDSDVDASNLHLLLRPILKEKESFWGGNKCYIDESLCSHCGLCKKLCRFQAIIKTKNKFKIEERDCEGCGLCAIACPTHAIIKTRVETGKTFLSLAQGNIPFSHATLFAGADNSGKLVTKVRENAKGAAFSKGMSFILNDGPPGIACPVISSLTGVQYALVVTEPTLSGVHDMQRVLKLARHFQVKTFVVINKADINPSECTKIKELALVHQATFLGEIPYDTNVNEALSKGMTIVEHGKGKALESILSIWSKLQEEITK